MSINHLSAAAHRVRSAHARRLLIAVLAGLALVAAACGGSTSAQGPTATPFSWQGALVTPPFEKPDIVLTDTSNKPFDFKKDTQGYVTLLYIGYLQCPDICPQHMSDLRQAFIKLPVDVTKHVRVVFVTADPDRDTPPLIRKWLDSFNTGFIGLYGTQAKVDAFQVSLGLEPAKKVDLGGGNYAVSHAAYVIAFGTDNVAHLVYPSGITADTWIHDLPQLVKAGWKGQ
jgi:protein SCO1/2